VPQVSTKTATQVVAARSERSSVTGSCARHAEPRAAKVPVPSPLHDRGRNRTTAPTGGADAACADRQAHPAALEHTVIPRLHDGVSPERPTAKQRLYRYYCSFQNAREQQHCWTEDGCQFGDSTAGKSCTSFKICSRKCDRDYPLPPLTSPPQAHRRQELIGNSADCYGPGARSPLTRGFASGAALRGPSERGASFPERKRRCTPHSWGARFVCRRAR
jgi:hypothetical protein